MSKRKANITPEDLLEHYQDAKGEIWRLIECEIEPHATMKRVFDEVVETKPISEFKDFVRLQLVSPRTHRKQKQKRLNLRLLMKKPLTLGLLALRKGGKLL